MLKMRTERSPRITLYKNNYQYKEWKQSDEETSKLIKSSKPTKTSKSASTGALFKANKS